MEQDQFTPRDKLAKALRMLAAAFYDRQKFLESLPDGLDLDKREEKKDNLSLDAVEAMTRLIEPLLDGKLPNEKDLAKLMDKMDKIKKEMTGETDLDDA